MSADRPRAAAPVFPLPGHRTMAQVMRAEESERQRQMRLPAEVYDYGSPYARRGEAA